jgi:hypothetical protein
MLKIILKRLEKRLREEPPSVLMLDVAAILMACFPRSELPDWVEALANGNYEAVTSVVEVALEDIQAEEVENDPNP